MKSRPVWLVIVAMLLGASSAFAQMTQGRLTGTVTDAQGAVMPGVTVTVTSPAMIGSQNTVTEANGRYLFPSLPSGTYKVAFELSGFQKVNRENINVVTGQTISADVQLQVASLAESVTVTGASPVVDVTTTKVGTSLKGEELTAVPNSTDAWGALSEAPGIRMQGFDVGGSHKSQQSGYEVFGIQNQSRIVTDGVDHTEGVGGTGYYEDYYANEEVSISALGSDVEMNSGGAAVVTTIKSGGNQFKGLENFTYESGSWVGDNNTAELRARGFTGNPNLLFYEGHADLGGPIMRDKAWFFVAYNTFKIDKVVRHWGMPSPKAASRTACGTSKSISSVARHTVGIIMIANATPPAKAEKCLCCTTTKPQATIPITIEGTPFRTSAVNLTSRPSRPRPNSARYTPAPIPMGTPIQLAIARIIIEPRIPFAIPPPCSPTGFWIWVKNAQLTEPAPLKTR